MRKKNFCEWETTGCQWKRELVFLPAVGERVLHVQRHPRGHRCESQDGTQLQCSRSSSKFGENRRVAEGCRAAIWVSGRPLWDQQTELAWPVPLKSLLIPKGDCGKYLTNMNCAQLIDKLSTVWSQTIWSKILVLIPLYREKTSGSLGRFHRRKGRGHTNLVAIY